LFPALCDLFGLDKAIELLKRPYATYGLGKAEIKEETKAQLSLFNMQKHRIQERENQTHLFNNQEFTYKGVGVFSKGQLMVSL
jgi:dihydroorotase-like cyclic amidohydrolase